MPRGGKRPGAGRPKGSPNKRTLAFREALEKIGGGKGASPELVLAEVMLNKAEPTTVRVQAASALLPYLHSKMPTAIDLGLRELAPVEIRIIAGGGDDGSTPSR